MAFNAYGSNNNYKPKAGGMWKRVSNRSGDEFLSGQIEITEELIKRIQNAEPSKNGKKYISFLAFENPKPAETDAKFPDYNVFYSDTKNNR
jgi:hypothetical protein